MTYYYLNDTKKIVMIKKLNDLISLRLVLTGILWSHKNWFAKPLLKPKK